MAFPTTERLARASARRPWLVVGIWIVVLVIGGFLASGINGVLTSDFKFTTKPESAKADQLLQDRLRGPDRAHEQVLLRSTTATVDDPAFRAPAELLIGEMRVLGGTVESAVSYYETQSPDLVSQDRRTLLVPVTLLGKKGEAADNVAPLMKVIKAADGRDGLEVLTAGDGSIARAFNQGSAKDAETGETIGIPVALIILLLVFGAAVAAGIPVLMAIVSIVVTFGVAAIIGQTYQLSFLLLNIVPMIGLAVGIDYTLLIVQRFREERAHGLDKHEAIAMAGATASRTVLFSGGTVIVGLLGMTVVPSTVYRSIAIGTSVVTAVAVLSALTLLPAVLSLLGDRVNWLKLPFIQGIVRRDVGADSGFWGRVASAVMRHPWVSVIGAGGLLVGLAVPALWLNLGLSGVTTLPAGDSTRQAFGILQSGFSAGRVSPVEIVVDAPDVQATSVQAAVSRLRQDLAADPSGKYGQATVETNPAGNLLLLSVPWDGDPNSDAAMAAVRRLRNDTIPAAFNGVDARVYVTGVTASNADFYVVIRTYAPYVFAFVLGLSFLLLMLVFRSIVVPAKALVLNLLSVGAAYGLLVLVFQDGVGQRLLGFQRAESIEAWLPLFLFSVLFGLSMDYHVFLLSRIRERFDETRDNAASVAFGLRSTAGMITGAALIMVAVFTGFALGDMVSLQQVGFGLAVAVILDATIIRSVLVPASMELLGDWNWYLPSWLGWLPRLQFEPRGHPRAPQPAPAPLRDRMPAEGESA